MSDSFRNESEITNTQEEQVTSSSSSSELISSSSEKLERTEDPNNVIKSFFPTSTTSFQEVVDRNLDHSINIYHNLLESLVNDHNQTASELDEINLRDLRIFCTNVKNECFMNEKYNKKLRLSTLVCGANALTDVSAVDIIIVSLLLRTNLHFYNIYRFLNPIFDKLANRRRERNLKSIEIRWDTYEEKIEFYTHREELPTPRATMVLTGKTVTEISNTLRKFLTQEIRTTEIIAPTVDSDSILDEKSNIRIKEYTRKHRRSRVNERPRQHKPLLNIYPVELERDTLLNLSYDIDGLSMQGPIDSLTRIKADFYLNSSPNNWPFVNFIDPSSICSLYGKPEYLKNLVRYPIGYFLMFGNIKIHVYGISKILKNGITPEEKEINKKKISEILLKANNLLKKQYSGVYYLENDKRNVEKNYSTFVKKYKTIFSEEVKRNKTRVVDEYIPKTTIKAFVKILLEDKELENIIDILHFETFGSKRFAFTASYDIESIYAKLEEVIDTSAFENAKIDIAIQAGLDFMNEETRGRILVLDTYFNTEFQTREMKVLGSCKIRNFYENITHIDRGKIVLEPTSVDKINQYTTLIPLLFQYRIRSLRTGEFTLISFLNNIKNLVAHDDIGRIINQKSTTLQNTISSVLDQLETRSEQDYTYRLEVRTGLVASGTIFHKMKTAVETADKSFFYTDKVHEFLKYNIEFLLALSSGLIPMQKPLESLLIWEIYIFNFLIKGTQNLHYVSTPDTRLYARNLIDNDGISFFNPVEIIQTMSLISDGATQNLRRLICSIPNISEEMRTQMQNIISITGDDLISEIANRFYRIYIRHVRNFEENILRKKPIKLTASELADRLTTDIQKKKFMKNTVGHIIVNLVTIYRKEEMPAFKKILANKFKNDKTNTFYIQKIYIIKVKLIPEEDSRMIINNKKPIKLVLFDFLTSMSSARTEIMKWEKCDYLRIHAMINHRRDFSDIGLKEVYEDLRYGFYGAVPFHKFIDAYKRTSRRMQSSVNSPFKVDEIGAETIIEIYKNRYGIIFTLYYVATLKTYCKKIYSKNKFINERKDHESQEKFLRFHRQRINRKNSRIKDHLHYIPFLGNVPFNPLLHEGKEIETEILERIVFKKKSNVSEIIIQLQEKEKIEDEELLMHSENPNKNSTQNNSPLVEEPYIKNAIEYESEQFKTYHLGVTALQEFLEVHVEKFKQENIISTSNSDKDKAVYNLLIEESTDASERSKSAVKIRQLFELCPQIALNLCPFRETGTPLQKLYEDKVNHLSKIRENEYESLSVFLSLLHLHHPPGESFSIDQIEPFHVYDRELKQETERSILNLYILCDYKLVKKVEEKADPNSEGTNLYFMTEILE